mgnify:CR=1 FL=1
MEDKKEPGITLCIIATNVLCCALHFFLLVARATLWCLKLWCFPMNSNHMMLLVKFMLNLIETLYDKGKENSFIIHLLGMHALIFEI